MQSLVKEPSAVTVKFLAACTSAWAPGALVQARDVCRGYHPCCRYYRLHPEYIGWYEGGWVQLLLAFPRVDIRTHVQASTQKPPLLTQNLLVHTHALSLQVPPPAP